MLTRASLAEQISAQLAFIKSKTEIMNSQGLYDIDIYMQDIICRLFNAAFGFHLKNLNKDKVTVEGIDLGDKEGRISVQVTSENTSKKIKETIQTFINHELYKDYDRVIIAMLTDKKKYTTSFDTQGLFPFDPAKDIIDLKNFAKLVKDFPLDKQKHILDILDEELGSQEEAGSTPVKGTIQSMEKRVLALCRSKLIAAGLDRTLAERIIENDITSDRYTDIIEATKNGKLYLQGEFGSGKSHALCILFFRMLNDYRADVSKPLPLYATASEIINAGGIQIWLQRHQTSNNNFIFIDGCDEMSIAEAQKLLADAQYLHALGDNMRFMLCGRPMHVFPQNDSVYTMPSLSDGDMTALIASVSGRNQTAIQQLLFTIEKGIKETLRRPFFSVIYANLLKQKGVYYRGSYSVLISHFIDWALSKCGSAKDDIIITLEKVAILSIDRNIGAVHISEIQGQDVYKALQQTGFLVLHRNNTVSFPLPIIAQWFAAEGVLHKRISIDDILDDEIRVSRWRYVFSIVFSKIAFDDSLELFGKIIKRDIGAVAEIIENGTTNEFMESPSSPLECGRKIRKCMEIWADALGELRDILTPIENHKLKKLAIDITGGNITTTWSNVPDVPDICVLSPQEQVLWRGVIQTRGIHLQATWPWILTFEMVRDGLKNAIKGKSILCRNDDILKEYVLQTTLSLLKRGSYCQEHIPLACIEKYRKSSGSILVIGRTKYQLDTFFSLVDWMYNNGEVDIYPTVPINDKELGDGGYVWDFYSEQRLFERVSAIYQKALQAYSDYTTSWFSSFARRMNISVMMPVKLHANLTFKEGTIGMVGAPCLSWHMEALPTALKNVLDLTLNQSEEWRNNYDEMHAILENDIRIRASQREWLQPSLHSGVLRCFDATPVTNVVFQWIEDDLKRIGWI